MNMRSFLKSKNEYLFCEALRCELKIPYKANLGDQSGLMWDNTPERRGGHPGIEIDG